MVGNALINISLWLWANITSRFFPVDLPFISLATLQTALDDIKAVAQPMFNFMNPYFPLDIFFNLLLAIIGIYILSFTFKVVVFFINIVRGSGA